VEPTVYDGAEGAPPEPPPGLPEGLLLLAVGQPISGADELADPVVAGRLAPRDEVLHPESHHLLLAAAIEFGEDFVALDDPAVPEEVIDLLVLGGIHQKRRDELEARHPVADQGQEGLIAVDVVSGAVRPEAHGFPRGSQ
jgi:hypothetical protein